MDISVWDPEFGRVHTGTRVCPNRTCQLLIFVAYSVRDDETDILVTYPPERIDFDSSELPDRVRDALEEAIACHANQCFAAAAMMVRKTLEELCKDRGAEGKDLNERISNLGATLPEEMLKGLHDLRLLGNDAAHVESREYDSIGAQEVEVAIAVAKEILKATYQMKAIMGQLAGLKKSAPAPE